MNEEEQARHDEPLEKSQKSYHTILEQQISQAEEELKRPAPSLFFSGLTAGMDLGFGILAMAISHTLLKNTFSPEILRFIGANLYAIGFVFVVIGHSSLFTEQTTSAIQPVLDGRNSVGSLLRLWGIVLVANLIGSTAFAWFISILGPSTGMAEPESFGEVARKLVSHEWWVMLISAVAAGWIMGMLSWLVNAARDTIAQIVIIWLCAFLIGIGQMHHSIAGTTEVLTGVFLNQGVSFGDFGRFIVWAVLGNVIGGVIFVAVLKYGHVKGTND